MGQGFLTKRVFFTILINTAREKVSDPEEEPYSIIFASLKHPVRRKILRMLSEKSMSFSEMLDTLKVSSPFLTYHLENLGELVCKAADGKNRLSTFGDTAILTMSRVEDMPKLPSSRSNRNNNSRLKTVLTVLHGMANIFLIVLAIALIFAGLYFENYTTSTTYLKSWGPDLPLLVHPNQNFTFYIAIDHRPLASYLTPNDRNHRIWEYVFENNNTYWFEMPTGSTPTWWRAVSVQLSLRPSVDMKFSRALLWNETGGTVLNPEYDYRRVLPGDFTNLIDLTDVTQPILYGLVIINLNPLKDMNDSMQMQAEWKLVEKPYFYYGQMGLVVAGIGLIIALLYPILRVSEFLWGSMKQSMESKIQLEILSSAQTTFKGEVLDKQLVARLAKKYTRPEQALRYWLERKMSQGRTREQALKEIGEENA